MTSRCCISSMLSFGLALLTLLCTCVLLADARRKSTGCPRPQSCDCYYDERYVDCSNGMFGPYSPELPDNHEPFTWRGDFSNNDIFKLQNLSFYTSPTEVILFHDLDYSFNYIRAIEPEAFKGLNKSLHTLNLSHNQLTAIPQQAFQPLTSLKKLYLDNNKILTIDFICNTHMPHLYQLYLRNNSITVISPTCFYDTKVGLKAGSELNLDYNRLRYLDFCTFKERQFQCFHYQKNQLICTCGMTWLANYETDSTSFNLTCLSSTGEISLAEYDRRFCSYSSSYSSSQCHDLDLTASRLVVDNGTTVHLEWQVQNIAALRHFKVHLYSVDENNYINGLGSYDIKNRTQHYFTITKVAVEVDQELIACIQASERPPHYRQDIDLMPLRASEKPEDKELLGGTFPHTNCQTVKKFEAPDMQALRTRSAASFLAYSVSTLLLSIAMLYCL